MLINKRELWLPSFPPAPPTLHIRPDSNRDARPGRRTCVKESPYFVVFDEEVLTNAAVLPQAWEMPLQLVGIRDMIDAPFLCFSFKRRKAQSREARVE